MILSHSKGLNDNVLFNEILVVGAFKVKLPLLFDQKNYYSKYVDIT